jgi:hypothetical protein
MSAPQANSARSVLAKPWIIAVLLTAAAALAGALAYPRQSVVAPGTTAAPVVEVQKKPGRSVLPRAPEGAELAPERTTVAVATLSNVAAVTTSAPASEAVYASPAAELGALRERLPGERLTLEHRGRSLDAIRRALGSELDARRRADLEARHASLELKQRALTERVARMEQRIELLERPEVAPVTP